MRVQVSSRFKVTQVVMAFIAVAFVVILFAFAIKQAAAAGEPVITGGAAFSGTTDVYLPVSGVTIDGDAVGSLPVSLKVTSGTLRLDSTTGLTLSGTASGSAINFSGSKEDINAALATLEYRANNPTVATFTATIGSADMVYYPGNGHVYEVVYPDNSIDWVTANGLAQARTFNGATGYLATITTEDENDYITARMSGDGWFGASDAQTEDDWKWVTGPEAGLSFWSGLGAGDGGQSVDGEFSNWASGEPNNAGDEDCGQFYGNGSGWNDLPCTGATLGSYVVEYGTDGALPAAPSVRTFDITTTPPVPQTVEVNSCEDFFDDFVGNNEHRYDNITLSQDIDCTGYTLPSLFTELDDETYEFLGFRGTFNGNGHTISNLTTEAVMYGDDNYSASGLFGYVDGGTISNLVLENVNATGYECVGSIAGSATHITISNVEVNGVVQHADNAWGDGLGGLVGCIETENGDSEISDATFTGIIGEEGDYSQYIGGVVGQIEATDGYAVSIDGTVTDATIYAQSGVGGVVGQVYSYDEGSSVTISNTSSGALSSDEAWALGGTVGYAYLYDGSELIIDAVTITGAISGGSGTGGVVGYIEAYDDDTNVVVKNTTISHPVVGSEDEAGGIVGYIEAESDTETVVTIENVGFTSTVTGTWNVGGIVGNLSGYIDDGDNKAIVIDQSYVSGAVTSTEDGYVGGLVGDADGLLINESYAVGSVNGVSTRAGGLVGAGYQTVVLNSYARNTVSADGTVGGIFGHYDSESEIENSYATGSISGDSDTGGLVGLASGNIVPSVESYWDTQTTGQGASTIGTAKTTAQLKSADTFVGWDFDGVWGITAQTNDGYPCLRWTDACTFDTDTDGVATEVEDAAPNNGDGNNDSIDDSEQSNVTSLVSPVTGEYMTLEVSDACSLSDVSVASAASIETKDANYQYSNGLVNFNASCGTPGVTITVTQYYYGLTSTENLVVRKYNPVTNQYQTVVGHNLSLTIQNLDGQSVGVLQYTVTDGDELDTDGVVNGEIVDPIGLASTLVSAPNTGLETKNIFWLFIAVATGITSVLFAAYGATRLLKR